MKHTTVWGIIIGLAVFALGSDTSSAQTSNATTCRAWIEKVAKTPRTLKQKLTVYHWFNCKNASGYHRSGDLKKVADKYLQKATTKSSGIAGVGLYAATDPSITCHFAARNPLKDKRDFSGACLLVLDLPRGEAVGWDRIFDPTTPNMEVYKTLKTQGCLQEDRVQQFYDEYVRDVKNAWIRDPKGTAAEFDVAPTPEGLQSILGFEYFIGREHMQEMLTSAFAVYLGSASLNHIYKEQLGATALHSYKYSTHPINATTQDKRALVLKPDILPRTQYRAYELKDLQTLNTPEAQNIRSHLSHPKHRFCAQNLNIPLTQKHHSSFATWLKGLGSQYDFGTLATTPVMFEGSATSHGSR